MRQLKISKQFTNRENKSLDKYLNELSADGSNQGSATCNFARAVYAESLRLIDELIAEYKTQPEQETK